MFALGVYAVETSLPWLAERSREALPANMAASDPASVVTAASNTAASKQAAAPVQLTAQSPTSATDAAAQAAPRRLPPRPRAPPSQPRGSARASTPPPPAPPPPASQAEASAPRSPRRGYGFLKLNSSQNATVYVTGVAVGPSNQPIEVRCGRFFVRLGEPTRNGTRWLAEGRTVRIKCGALTEAAF
ncbi:uncharacterized protein SOCE836_087750 [Sorangium cellulosum]|uniref:Uncharacterized protein n=1 Tax=Sorangium cellulosum TaxID=56 RepID=A0A4P2R0Y0_SORCE|nr:uncharacterized protein SOCE836_087750 [Sorangium cellulosum]